MSPESPIHIALVEDQQGLREALKEVIDCSDGLKCVGTFANAEQSLVELPALNPQVVFMDINLPGMDGVSCVKELVKILPNVLVVMLTTYDNTEEIFGSLEAGACGYLHKPIKGKDLAEAARSVMAGGSPMSAKIARLVVQKFKAQTPVASDASYVEYELTSREHEVLSLLVQGFLYKEIADQINVSHHTVNFHIRNIYQKLQVRSRAQAVAKVMRNP